jgi:hypothetical protein
MNDSEVAHIDPSAIFIGERISSGASGEVLKGRIGDEVSWLSAAGVGESRSISFLAQCTIPFSAGHCNQTPVGLQLDQLGGRSRGSHGRIHPGDQDHVSFAPSEHPGLHRSQRDQEWVSIDCWTGLSD